MLKRKVIVPRSKTSLKETKSTPQIEASSQEPSFVSEETISPLPTKLFNQSKLSRRPYLNPDEVLQLHRTVGNQAVRRLLANQVQARPHRDKAVAGLANLAPAVVVQRKVYEGWGLDHLKIAEVKKKIDEIQAMPDQWAAADQLYAFSEFLFEILGDELAYARADNKPKPAKLDKDQSAAWELLDYFDSPGVAAAALAEKPSVSAPPAQGEPKSKNKKKKAAAPVAAPPPLPTILDLSSQLEALKQSELWKERSANIELGYTQDKQEAHKSKVTASILKSLKTQITQADDPTKIQAAAKALSDLQNLLHSFQKAAAPAKKKLAEEAASQKAQHDEIVDFITQAMASKFWPGLSAKLRAAIGTELKTGIEKGDWKSKLVALLGRKKTLKKNFDKEVESIEEKAKTIKSLVKTIEEKGYLLEVSFPADLAERIKKIKKDVVKDDWVANIDTLNYERLEIQGLYEDWLDNEFTAVGPVVPTPRLATNYFQEHIMVRHSLTSPAPNAGKFNSDEWPAVKGYIDSAKQHGALAGPILNEEGGHPNGRFEITHTFPANIGTKINTDPTSRIKLIITRSGKSVVTAYPY